MANTPANDLTDPGYDGDRERCAKGSAAVIVAAAGNGAGRDERQYPAAEGACGLIAVAASAANGRLAGFGNFGNWIHIAAPGDGVTSSVPGGWGTWSGTSMAAPWVTGAAALVRARAPALSSVDTVRRLVRSASLPCATPRRSGSWM